jgi:hypothetical protein
MKNIELVRHRDSLNAAIGRAKDLTDVELLGHWGKYVCVLTSGFLENIIRELYGKYVERKATPKIAAFVVRQLDRVNNPKAARFLEIADAFSPTWALELTAFLDDDGARRRDAIDSIVANRHLIAHGRSVGISVSRVREYFVAINEVADFVEKQCGG